MTEGQNHRTTKSMLENPMPTNGHLDLSGKPDLLSSDVKSLVEVLNKHPEIFSLNLTHTRIDDTAASVLESLQHVSNINLSGTNMSYGARKRVTETLRTKHLPNTEVQELSSKETNDALLERSPAA